VARRDGGAASKREGAGAEEVAETIKRSRQDDLAAHGVKLSHVTVRKIIADRRTAA
jgi:hypothetical protein